MDSRAGRSSASTGENGISWAPDGRRLAGIAKDGSLKVWDAVSGRVLFTVKQVGHLATVAFSPNGKRLATGGTEGIIRLYDAGSGQERAALFTGCMNVSSLAFYPDGRRLFAAGWGMGGVKVFDAERDPRGRVVTPWLDQLAALAFVGESQRLHGIGWQGGHLASLDFSAGVMSYEANIPVTNSRVWPRGDFAFSVDGRHARGALATRPGCRRGLGRRSWPAGGDDPRELGISHRRRLQPGRETTGHRGH